MSGTLELIGTDVVDKSGNLVPVVDFVKPDNVIGLYFSASWCPERLFTSFLTSFFCHFRQQNKNDRFNIVYVSADQDEESFNEYLKEMPWHAIPFSDHSRRVSR